MSPEYTTALLRACWIAIPLGALTTLTTWQQVGRWEPALVAGGVTLFGVIATRGGVEGWIDSRAAALAAKPPAAP